MAGIAGAFVVGFHTPLRARSDCGLVALLAMGPALSAFRGRF
jgi:hypothetical protein